MTEIKPVRALLDCVLRIGDRVEISSTYEWAGDWRGWKGYVCGINARPSGTGIDICVSDEWPPVIKTDGFYPHELDIIPVTVTPEGEAR